MKQCPLCGSPHDTIDGVIMHMRNSKDDTHKHIHNQLQAAEHIQNAENGGSEVSLNTDSEDTGGVPEGTQKQNTEGVPPSSMFDEPDSGTELSDFEGESVRDMVALPCGHEEVHPSDIPEEATVIVCEVCGRKYGVSDV